MAPEANAQRKLAKIDLDADFNYDGTIDNYDPTDNGSIQVTPPGLIVGVGELAKMIVRIRPYKEDRTGEAVFILDVSGINRTVESGEFESLDDEIASMGQVRVWSDAYKTELLVDSADPNLRRRIWTAEDGQPPTFFYVEGVRPSTTEGDVRVLVSLESRRKVAETFDPSFDHNLVTVSVTPHPKAGDTSVWITPSGKDKGKGK